MATPPPPLSPTVATPLAHRKRRHSEINNPNGATGSGSGSGSQRPKLSEVAESKKSSPNHKAPVFKDRLQVPSQQARGRSSTPVKRERSATPVSVTSSSGVKKSQIHRNGATLSPRPRPTGEVSKPGGSRQLNASPYPKRVEGRPGASPRPGNGAVRPSASPRPNGAAVGRTGASPRPAPSISSRLSPSARPKVAERPSASPRPKEVARRRIEDSSDEDSDAGSDFDKSDIEDIVDSAELEPFSLSQLNRRIVWEHADVSSSH